jgi:hypothetical protein
MAVYSDMHALLLATDYGAFGIETCLCTNLPTCVECSSAAQSVMAFSWFEDL